MKNSGTLIEQGLGSIEGPLQTKQMQTRILTRLAEIFEDPDADLTQIKILSSAKDGKLGLYEYCLNGDGNSINELTVALSNPTDSRELAEGIIEDTQLSVVVRADNVIFSPIAPHMKPLSMVHLTN